MVRGSERQDVHTVFELLNAYQADLPVSTMCRVLGVSHGGYYDWLRRAPSQRALDDAVLTELVRTELAEQGVRVGGKRIARLVRAAGLSGVSKRRSFVVTTQRDRRLRPMPDLVQRTFCADGPNQL